MRVPKITPTRKGVAVKVLVFAVAVMLGITAYLYSMRSRSVLYRYYLAGNPVKQPDFIIFNPFRDRSPEHSAEVFLEVLRAGQCEQALAVLPLTPEYRQDTCEREGRYPLTSWRLMNRTDEPQKVRMYYHVWRENYGGSYGSMWVTVEKQGEQWQVTDFDRFY